MFRWRPFCAQSLPVMRTYDSESHPCCVSYILPYTLGGANSAWSVEIVVHAKQDKYLYAAQASGIDDFGHLGPSEESMKR
jgi:hypothetical protein